MNQADLSRLVSLLKISVNAKPRRLPNPEGPAGRLKKLKATVTALIKYERIELNHPRADEARAYAERVYIFKNVLENLNDLFLPKVDL